MDVKTLFFVALLIIGINGRDCPPEREHIETSWEEKLQKKQSDAIYNFAVSFLANDTQIIDIHVVIAVESFAFDESRDSFSVTANTMYAWDIGCIKWNPKDYGNLEFAILNDLYFMLPFVKLMNSMEMNEFMYKYSYNKIWVYSKGLVMYNSNMVLNAACSTDIKHWPFDTQNCTLYLGAYESYRNKINFVFGPGMKIMIVDQDVAGWSIIDYSVGDLQVLENGKRQKQLYVSFLVQRHGKVLAAILIYPSVIAAMLTITSLALDLENFNRIALVYFSILCHFTLMNVANDEIPKISEDAPNVVLFIRNSLFMSVAVAVMSHGLRYLRAKTTLPPSWISATNGFVLTNRYCAIVKYYIVTPIEMSEEFNDTDGNEAKIISANEWKIFSDIANFVCLIIVVFVYFILLALKLPYIFTHRAMY